MRNHILLPLIIAALGLVSPAPMHAWQLADSQLKRVPIPSTLHVIPTTTSSDLDRDDVSETLTLTDGRVIIASKGETRWESPAAWEVRQAQITDLNRDGNPEAALLVWRPFKPWPIDTWLPNGGRIENFHDGSGRSCHMILIGWKQGSFRELWAGSAMAEPVNRFAAVDLRGNSGQVLIALEGEYGDPPSVPSRRLKVWEWNGFGFTVVNELADSFHLMVPVQTDDGRVLILTD